MASRDAADLVEGYRPALRECLLRIDEPSVLHLRGEPQVTRSASKRGLVAFVRCAKPLEKLRGLA